jgi:hypothetical protein
VTSATLATSATTTAALGVVMVTLSLVTPALVAFAGDLVRRRRGELLVDAMIRPTLNG